MRLLWLNAFVALFLSQSVFANTQQAKGHLLAVGGSLTASNAEIYQRFIALAGGAERARIGILPAASGKPAKYSDWFKDDLVRYGLKPEQIEIIPIAVKDEKKTEADESKWIANAQDKTLAEKVKGYTGIWFLGGDQMRITQALLANGEPTPVLKAMHQAYQQGAVIGGTSAGAAMMSDVMIASGDSMGALTQGFTSNYENMNEQESGPVFATQGLGFFQQGVIDQHFDRKARLGRLIVVNQQFKVKYPLGFGIDENSGFVYSAAKNSIEAVGYGGITVVDLRESSHKTLGTQPNRYSAWQKIRISFLQGGDKLILDSMEFKVNEKKYDTVGYEYMEVPNPYNNGIFSRNPNYKDLITYDLVDNKLANEVTSLSFAPDGTGFEARFYQDKLTTGWWNYIDGLRDNYSAVNVLLDITPIKVSVERMQ